MDSKVQKDSGFTPGNAYAQARNFMWLALWQMWHSIESFNFHDALPNNSGGNSRMKPRGKV